jgi:Transglycosylase SLT domain
LKKTIVLVFFGFALSAEAGVFDWVKTFFSGAGKEITESAVSVNDKEFTPSHRLSGVGIDRQNITDAVLTERTRRMMDNQTFGILRDPDAVAGAGRVASERFGKMFEAASVASGFSRSKLEAIAYVESYGRADAVSTSGPRGIMQFTADTARVAGVIHKEDVLKTLTLRIPLKDRKGRPLKKGGKLQYRTVRKKRTVKVEVDDRMKPDKAISGAARYLSYLSRKYGSEDLAIFAYHCGEGCMAQFLEAAKKSERFKAGVTAPKLFFLNSPAWNRELYRLVAYHMKRDWSPTYYFRVARAEELLALYRTNRSDFGRLLDECRNKVKPENSAPYRFWAWLGPKDLIYEQCEDLIHDPGHKLVKALDRPDFYGFLLRKDGPGSIGEMEEKARIKNRKKLEAYLEKHLKHKEYYLQASASAIGALAYVTFETRRLFEAAYPKKKWAPLEVTALVRALEYQGRLHGDYDVSRTALPSHCTGEVFDLSYKDITEAEYASLLFVLEDIGNDGYLSYIVESGNCFHVVHSPSSATFFSTVYQEALSKKR